MAAIMYYMLCETATHEIKSFSTEDIWQGNVADHETRSASFSSNPGDSPDILKDNPCIGGSFQEPSSYSPPIIPGIKIEWSGTGAEDGNDGAWEASVGSGSITMDIKKWDLIEDVAISEAGDSFGICLTGALIPSEGRVTLDLNGEATVTFDLVGAPKGVFMVETPGINNALSNHPDNKYMIRLI
jgi:hypothetical protein